MIVRWLKTYSLILLAITLALAVGMMGVQTLRLANEKANFAGYKVEVGKVELQRERTYSQDLQASRNATEALQKTIHTNQRLQDEQIDRINTRHAAAVASLRHRPEARATSIRPATNAAGVAEGATGLQLSGPDGRFLAGEAARADTLRSALETCYKNYDAARDGLKTYGEGLAR